MSAYTIGLYLGIVARRSDLKAPKSDVDANWAIFSQHIKFLIGKNGTRSLTGHTTACNTFKVHPLFLQVNRITLLAHQHGISRRKERGVYIIGGALIKIARDRADFDMCWCGSESDSFGNYRAARLQVPIQRNCEQDCVGFQGAEREDCSAAPITPARYHQFLATVEGVNK